MDAIKDFLEFFIIVNGYFLTIGIAMLQVSYFIRRIRDDFKHIND